MPFPAVIDNTIRTTFVNCHMKAKYKHVDNLRLNDEEMVDKLFGGCFSTGCEHTRKAFWFEGKTEKEAVQIGIDAAFKKWDAAKYDAPTGHVKQRHRIEGALWYYFTQFPLDDDEMTPLPGGVEKVFSIPLPGFLHPDTGEQLCYAGRYDMLALKLSNPGRYYAVDEKTTKRLGELWMRQWEMDTQTTGYIWSVLQALLLDPNRFGDLPEVQARIRGISILKDDYGHAEVDIVRSPWMIAMWRKQLDRDVSDMIFAYKSGEWDYALHPESCVSFTKPCPYLGLCQVPPSQREMLIPLNYHERVWNPLDRGQE